MSKLPIRIVRNAASNLIRGGASAVVALALPHFLTQSLSIDKFSAWSLILQIAAYASYLDFGLQTAVARYLSQAIDGQEHDRARDLVNTAFLMLSIAGLVAAAMMGAVLWNQDRIFHGIPPGLVQEFRAAALLMGLSAAVQLPLSTFTGVLVGFQRNELPALAIGSTRIAGAIATILAAHRTSSLVTFAAIVGGANLLGGLIQAYMARRLMPNLKIRLARVDLPLFKEIAHYCSGLTVWAFGMLLVSGLDVTIVGHVQFEAVGYYSLAALLINFLSGLNSSAFAALLAPLSVLHAHKENARISGVVLYATRLNTMANLVLTFILFGTGDILVGMWCGPAYARQAMPIIRILLVAQTIRLAMSAYSIALVSTGEQNRTVAPVLLEAFVNLTCSIAGAIGLGPIGVAWGTLMGAVSGFLWLVIKTMPASLAIPLTPRAFLHSGIVRPVVACFPLLVYSVWASNFLGLPVLKAATFACALLFSCFLFKKTCFAGAPSSWGSPKSF